MSSATSRLWLSEAVDTLLGREADDDRLWASLVEFGALSVGGDEGLGAVELCLIARALGAHLAPVPYLGSAAVRFAAPPLAAELGDGGGGARVARAGLELGGCAGGAPARGGRGRPCRDRPQGWRWSMPARSRVSPWSRPPRDGPALAIVDAGATGVTSVAQPAFDPTAPMYAVELADAPVVAGPFGGEAIRRMTTIGALLAAAEAVGAAGRMLDDACRYAAERRQFGRTIGSFQALRHLLADMYVRQASSWSSVLYAAAALDEDAGEAPRTASIAKAYVSRAAREVAHGAMQVFGGIAVTAEHPAHRFLRRIVVRERQFGDAAHHERALGRALAVGRRPGAGELMATASGFNDPTAQRLEPITTGAEPHVVGPLLADALHDPRWLGVRRRADLRRQVEPHVPGGVRRRRGGAPPSAARARPADRARHGARAPRPARARGHGRARSPRPAPRRRRRPARGSTST